MYSRKAKIIQDVFNSTFRHLMGYYGILESVTVAANAKNQAICRGLKYLPVMIIFSRSAILETRNIYQ